MRNPLPGLSSVTGAAVCSAATAAAVGVVTARFLGPDGQGSLTLVTTIVALMVVMLTLGTGASLRLRSGGEPGSADVKAFFGLSVVLSPVAGVAVVVIVYLVQPGMLDLGALVLAGVFGAVSLAGRQLCDLVQAYGRTASSIISIAVGSLVQAGSFAILVAVGAESLAGALGCAILGSLIQIIYALFAIRAYQVPRSPNIRTVIWRSLVGVGVPTLGFSLGLLAMQRVDRLILVGIAGTTAGGIYSVAATVAEAARITSSAIGQLLFVRASARRRITRDVTRLYYGGILLQILVLGVLAVADPFIVRAFFGSAFELAISPLRGLLVAEFFMGIALMDSRMLMGLGYLKEVGAITLGAVSVGIVLYVCLISQYGTTGAVVATMITYTGFSITTFARRVHHARKVINV